MFELTCMFDKRDNVLESLQTRLSMIHPNEYKGTILFLISSNSSDMTGSKLSPFGWVEPVCLYEFFLIFSLKAES